MAQAFLITTILTALAFPTHALIEPIEWSLDRTGMCTFDDCRGQFTTCLDTANGLLEVDACQQAFAACRGICKDPDTIADTESLCFIEVPTTSFRQRPWLVRPDAVDAITPDGDILRVELQSGTRLRVPMTADDFLDRLRQGCHIDEPSAELTGLVQPQGVILDILRKGVERLAADQERTARWIAALLKKASQRGHIDLDPAMAEDFADWLAEGLAIVTRVDFPVRELADWVREGIDLFARAHVAGRAFTLDAFPLEGCG